MTSASKPAKTTTTDKLTPHGSKPQSTPPFSAKPQRTILYIEDDPASRTLVERTLRFAGYRILVAERGIEGIDMARREQPDLILTDIDLPDLSGRELTTMLRTDARFRTTPIVALTAAGVGEGRELTLAAGLDGYLTKPIDIEALPSQVEHYLNGGRDAIEASSLPDAQRRYAQEIVRRLEGRIRELEGRNSDLHRLDQMKDAFIQITAHELRTPLTLVIGYTRLMSENTNIRELMAFDTESAMLVNGMNNAITRMRDIINEIVTVSRIVTNQVDITIGPVSLGEVVGTVIREYDAAVKGRKLSVVFNRADFPERLLGDWELLNLVFRNLISNAIKYTPDGGTITIKAALETLAGQPERVRVTIRDTGIGVEPAQLERIFEHFFTTSDTDTALHSTSKTAFKGGGLGLGLALCRGIVVAHGGRIWARSDGRSETALPGSEFVVELPLVAERPPRVARGAHPS